MYNATKYFFILTNFQIQVELSLKEVFMGYFTSTCKDVGYENIKSFFFLNLINYPSPVTWTVILFLANPIFADSTSVCVLMEGSQSNVSRELFVQLFQKSIHTNKH